MEQIPASQAATDNEAPGSDMAPTQYNGFPENDVTEIMTDDEIHEDEPEATESEDQPSSREEVQTEYRRQAIERAEESRARKEHRKANWKKFREGLKAGKEAIGSYAAMRAIKKMGRVAAGLFQVFPGGSYFEYGYKGSIGQDIKSGLGNIGGRISGGYQRVREEASVQSTLAKERLRRQQQETKRKLAERRRKSQARKDARKDSEQQSNNQSN